MCVPNCMAIHPIVVKKFHLKTNKKNQSAGGARGKVRGIIKVFRTHPLGTINTCRKFHGIQQLWRYFNLDQSGGPADIFLHN